LKPLEMTSSGFYVADAEAGRIAEPPGRSFDREATSVMPDVTKNPSFAGGMVSTAADYVRARAMQGFFSLGPIAVIAF
jgi:CubicO group peptidase (beta-lactamase class C family)